MSLSSDGLLLAVGRENRSIEIWKTDTFTQLVVIPGHKNVDLRNLHWVEPGSNKKRAQENPLYYNRVKGGKTIQKKRRLVSTSLNGLVIEWDLFTLAPKSKYQAHGAIWDSKVSQKFMFVACEDGSVKILKIKKTKIEMVKLFVKSSSACLSLALVHSEKSQND